MARKVLVLTGLIMMWLGLLGHLADYTIPPPRVILGTRSVLPELNTPIFFAGLIMAVIGLLRTTHPKLRVLVGSISTVLVTIYLFSYLIVCSYPILAASLVTYLLFTIGLTILIVEVLEKITENPTQPTHTRS